MKPTDLYQGSTGEKRSRDLFIFVRVAIVIAFVVVICAFSGCASIHTDHDGTVWNDLSKCAPHATSCYINDTAYCSEFDVPACAHEREHKLGMRHTAWDFHGREACAVITDAGQTAWKVGQRICRSERGFYVSAPT